MRYHLITSGLPKKGAHGGNMVPPMIMREA
jgi:hypothetical protein